MQIEHRSLGEDAGSAAILWLNRPDSLNALDWSMVLALGEALDEVHHDDSVRVILITGRGRAFSAGGDLKAYVGLQEDAEEFGRFVDDFHAVFGGIKYMQKPVVALVNGICVAGGLELLLSCDFGYAAASASIGDSHLNFGQIGGGGVLALLPRSIGPARARELSFSGRRLPAEEALEWGLVNRVLPDDELLEAGLEFAREVAAKSMLGLATAKYVMNAGWADGVGVTEALRLERERNVIYCVTAADAREGLAAFAEKRKPRYGSRLRPRTSRPPAAES